VHSEVHSEVHSDALRRNQSVDRWLKAHCGALRRNHTKAVWREAHGGAHRPSVAHSVAQDEPLTVCGKVKTRNVPEGRRTHPN
jgi:hypothetical protein